MRAPTAFVAAFIAAFAWLAPLSAGAANPGVVDIQNPSVYSKVVVMSDAHGHYTNTITLLENAGVIGSTQHWTGGKTLVVVIGDNIDKGGHSLDVIRLWMRLQAEAPSTGGRVVTLLGNHEAEFLADPHNDKAVEFVDDAQSAGYTVTDLVSDSRPVGHFLREMPVAARVGKWVFCHAGWVPNQSWSAFVSTAQSVLGSGYYGSSFLLGDTSILKKKDGANGKKWYTSTSEITELERRLTADGLYGVVFGHQPEAFGIKNDVGIYSDGRLVKSDSGMSDDAGGYNGHLLIFTKPGDFTATGRPQNLYSSSPNGSRRKL